MGKIAAFLLATVGLSLAILIPVYINFQIIAAKIGELGLKTFPNFWQGFALIFFAVVVSVVTLMALIVFGGEKSVVR